MKSGTIDLGIVLHEIVFLDNPPPRIRNLLAGLGVLASDVTPPEKGAILTDGVDLSPEDRHGQLPSHKWVSLVSRDTRNIPTPDPPRNMPPARPADALPNL